MDFYIEAQEIVNQFEKNYPIPTSIGEYEHLSEALLLYLAAKKYIERYS